MGVFQINRTAVLGQAKSEPPESSGPAGRGGGGHAPLVSWASDMAVLVWGWCSLVGEMSSSPRAANTIETHKGTHSR